MLDSAHTWLKQHFWFKSNWSRLCSIRCRNRYSFAKYATLIIISVKEARSWDSFSTICIRLTKKLEPSGLHSIWDSCYNENCSKEGASSLAPHVSKSYTQTIASIFSLSEQALKSEENNFFIYKVGLNPNTNYDCGFLWSASSLMRLWLSKSHFLSLRSLIENCSLFTS